MLKQAVGAWERLRLPSGLHKAAQDAADHLTQGIGCSDLHAHNQLIKWAEDAEAGDSINLEEDLDILAGMNQFTTYAPHSWFHISNIRAALVAFTTFLDYMGQGLNNPFRKQAKELSAWLRQKNEQLR